MQCWTNQDPIASLCNGLSARCFPGGSCPHPLLHTQGLEPHTCHQLISKRKEGVKLQHILCAGALPALGSILSPRVGGVAVTGAELQRFLAVGRSWACTCGGEHRQVRPREGELQVSPWSVAHTCKPALCSLGWVLPWRFAGRGVLRLLQTRACGSGLELKCQCIELSPLRHFRFFVIKLYLFYCILTLSLVFKS